MRFNDLYTPSEPKTEKELKEWILAHRKSPANNGTESIRIISKHISKIPEIHDSMHNLLLRVGFTGNNRKTYLWVGLKASDRLFCVSYDID